MNYERISTAIQYYKQLGYEWVDTPWIVSEETSKVTFSGEDEKLKCGYLVGSAEQGFIELIRKGKLNRGIYVSAGPCFRIKDTGKEYCEPYFFKVELVAYGASTDERILKDAKSFMGGESLRTEEGIDLILNGIEIGSYGARSFDSTSIAYGTGLAEPRYSYARQAKT